MNPLAASRATVQQKSSPQRFSGEELRKNKNAADLTNRVVSELAIPLLQQETQLFLTPGCLLLGPGS